MCSFCCISQVLVLEKFSTTDLVENSGKHVNLTATVLKETDENFNIQPVAGSEQSVHNGCPTFKRITLTLPFLNQHLKNFEETF